MSLPIDLHSNSYLEHLQNFRDSALVASRVFGKRRSIGAFTFGTAHAQWQGEEGGVVHLVEQGVRYKDLAITKLLSTTMRIYSSFSETGFEFVTFKMDIDNIGCIDIYHNLFTNGTFAEIIKAELHKRSDSAHGLSEPTDEQRALLYNEMSRGATGLYLVNA